MYTIGLTGGIGTGKSEVLSILRDLGASTVEADLLAHEIYSPGKPAWQDIIDTFGSGILTPEQQINRKKLGEIVFADRNKLSKLNQIVHPRIFDHLKELIEEQKMAGTRLLVIEAAVLIEAKWTEMVDSVWVVQASKGIIINRLKEKTTLTEEQITQRINAQISDAQRQEKANEILTNNGDKSDLRDQVRKLIIANNLNQE
tara:strand:+ start:105 stop:707 length:603 start_codon:yes stop_codon:yes gene_type:complete